MFGLEAFAPPQKKQTISENNAIKEFGITKQDLDTIPAEKVQRRSCHGNPYRLFVRDDVVALAKATVGEEAMQRTAMTKELAAVRQRVKKLTKELEMERARQAELEKKLGCGAEEEPAVKKRRRSKEAQ